MWLRVLTIESSCCLCSSCKHVRCSPSYVQQELDEAPKPRLQRAPAAVLQVLSSSEESRTSPQRSSSSSDSDDEEESEKKEDDEPGKQQDADSIEQDGGEQNADLMKQQQVKETQCDEECDEDDDALSKLEEEMAVSKLEEEMALLITPHTPQVDEDGKDDEFAEEPICLHFCMLSLGTTKKSLHPEELFMFSHKNSAFQCFLIRSN